ncbi:MAG: PAS domain S-box protein [candidate division Zixibacteria bacterium]|nr:PAS domain S-box protein [candidate division Zixibacteria bacterium]
MKNIRPGFLVRLSNIIIVQMLFVFAAVALVIFYPTGDVVLDSDLHAVENSVQFISEEVTRSLNVHTGNLREVLEDVRVQESLLEMLSREANLVYAGVFVQDTGQPMNLAWQYHDSAEVAGSDLSAGEALDLIHSRLQKMDMRKTDSYLFPLHYSSRGFIYGYRFLHRDATPAVFVTTVGHNFIISSRSHLQYALLLLFLGFTLVSLLTIYLISNRLKVPLERLLKGFEKTAEGELYYVIESEGDGELKKLADAFNNMSKALFENHSQLKAYNEQLQSTNRQLQESQGFFSTLINNSPVCVVSTSPEGKIMVFNRMASEDFGYDRKEIIGRSLEVLFANHHLNGFQDNRSDSVSKRFEVLCERKDGSVFPAYLVSSPVRGDHNEIIAHLYIIRDISESQSYQEMMIRIDRYYTRGEMAGDIAHEINNFLAVLSGNIELMPLMIKRGDHEKITQKLELMKATVDRIVRFTDGLMDANMGEVHFDWVDINQLVENVVAFLKPQNRFDEITVTTCLATNLSLVEVDVGEIQQLLVNLLNNASDALSETGRNGREIAVTTSLVSGADPATVRLEVRDNGPGVVRDKVDWLFHKRFTTKKKGHGIGLITCRKIVDAHQGGITYAFDGGAVFAAELPVGRRACGGEAPPVAQGHSTGRSA